MGIERRRAATGFAPGQTCCVGSAGGLPGPPSQQRLGTWHLAPGVTSAGLALWPPRRRRAPPFPVAGVVSLSQCGGVGVRGGHLPGVQAGPIRQYILGSQRLRRGRGEASSGSSSPLPPVGAWQSWRGPCGLSGTSSGQTLQRGRNRQGDSDSQGAAQEAASTPLFPSHCPDSALIPHIHSAPSKRRPAQQPG